MHHGGPAPAVRLRGICKRFGTVLANDQVDLSIEAGTIHGLVGENGAGKSTLMAVLYGLHAADAGQIEIDGRPVRLRHTRDAIALGVGMVHQHFLLVETFTALDNLLLGDERHARLAPARRDLRTRAEALMRETGLAVRLDARVEDLPVGERQRLEILKALLRGARLLVLDEPTAVLTPQEASTLFDTLRALRARGTTVVLISHKLREVLGLCDRVTVMRAGRVVLETAAADTDVDGLARAMVGRPVQRARPVHDASARGGLPAATPRSGQPRLAVQGLRLHDADGRLRLDDLSLALHPGEIVGVAGVSGNGQSELLDVLAGLRRPQAGRLVLGAAVFEAADWPGVRRVRALGLAHVPEDRHQRGLVLPLPAWESAALGHIEQAWCGPAAWLDHVGMRAHTRRLMDDWDVRPPDPTRASRTFSGGNQQKLVLARETDDAPGVLLVGQPTRGVDIGAIECIHDRLRALRAAGAAVLLVSSELDEILALSDRVLVMQGGRIVGERPIAECDETVLGRLMGGAGLASAA